ncbi:unnamed protein product, partial [Phaeothamnion confervicola]
AQKAFQAQKATMSRSRREATLTGDLASEVITRSFEHSTQVSDLVNLYALDGLSMTPADLERLKPHLLCHNETLTELGQSLEFCAATVEELRLRLRAANDDFIHMQKEQLHLRRDVLEK